MSRGSEKPDESPKCKSLHCLGFAHRNWNFHSFFPSKGWTWWVSVPCSYPPCSSACSWSSTESGKTLTWRSATQTSTTPSSPTPPPWWPPVNLLTREPLTVTHLSSRSFSSPIQSSIVLGESLFSPPLVCNLSQSLQRFNLLFVSFWICLCPLDLLVGLFIREILKLRKVSEKVCTVSVMVWLLNPFTFTIGTRGNCEPIVCAMLLWIIISLMKGTTSHTYVYIKFAALLSPESSTLRLRIVVTFGTTATRF